MKLYPKNNNGPSLQGNMSLSLNTESDGKRVEVTYICAKYDTDKAEWTEDCDTIYDKADPSAGVLCLCDHNTSFAVLMVSCDF